MPKLMLQRWSELFFGCLFANPGLTNVTWPGLDTPPPPLHPGGRIQIQKDIDKVVSGKLLEATVLRRLIGEVYGYTCDTVTALCLLRMDYRSKSACIDPRWVLTV
jgi:hypothetical protein